MKKMIIMVMMLVMVMGGMPVHAAETQKDNYRTVINGIEEDLAEEDGDDTIISVKRQEYPTERVMMYEIVGTSDGEVIKMFIYINGESQEVYAISYDSDGYVLDSEVMTLADAAELYAE